MTKPPDFDGIAHHAAQRVAEEGTADAVLEALTLVWNARGDEDIKAVNDLLATLTGWVTSEPYRQQLARAIEERDK